MGESDVPGALIFPTGLHNSMKDDRVNGFDITTRDRRFCVNFWEDPITMLVGGASGTVAKTISPFNIDSRERPAPLLVSASLLLVCLD